MNTQLEKLFTQYNISERDRYEISQIYSLLPFGKQKNLLDNFSILVQRLNKIEEEIREEREILLSGLYEDIDNAIERERRRRLVLNK